MLRVFLNRPVIYQIRNMSLLKNKKIDVFEQIKTKEDKPVSPPDEDPWKENNERED
tara:strand:+ start:192 stop:359 length:168 start_codon:yes stop_codon:yes gene_type:complete